jgi:hypothetical protein
MVSMASTAGSAMYKEDHKFRMEALEPSSLGDAIDAEFLGREHGIWIEAERFLYGSAQRKPSDEDLN